MTKHLKKCINKRVMSYTEIPNSLKNKKCLINIKNYDDKSFIWAITRALNKNKKNNDRIDKKLVSNTEKYNRTGITFPQIKTDYKIFEENNPEIRLVIYKLENEKIILDWLSPEKDREKEVILFLIKFRYLPVTDESRLLSSQLNSTNKCYFCKYCRKHFRSIRKKNVHEVSC